MKKLISKVAGVSAAAVIIMSTFSFAESNDFLILVNQTHPAGEHYEPKDLDSIGNYAPVTRVVNMRQEAVSSYVAMNAQMKAEGVHGMIALSGHRSYAYQKTLFDTDVSNYMRMGYSYQDAYNITKANVAVPGQSEHQTGLAVDVTIDGNLSTAFGNTQVGTWLRNNSHRFGFILRYNSDKKHITGINFEPWHFRYIGYPHSEIMYKNNFSLEEYTDYVVNTGEFAYSADSGEEYRITYRNEDNTEGIDNVVGVSSNNAGGFVITSKLVNPEGNGYITGYHNDEFRPDNKITRAEAAAIISRALGNYDQGASYGSTYTDVESDAWYYNIIGYMEESGIIKGYQDGNFKPESPITRAEFASILSRVKELKVKSDISFKDIKNHWAEDDILKLKNKNWVSGYADNSFRPENPITRAEAVKMVNNVIGYQIDENYIDSNFYNLRRFKDLKKDHWAFYEIMTATNMQYNAE